MRIAAKICKRLNKLFRKPIHPFNLRNEQGVSYAEWQFEKGIDTIKFFLPVATLDEMFKDKIVLDIGCGAAGKTLFYASQGVKKIYGLEFLEHYRDQANTLVEKYADQPWVERFEFLAADAVKLPFEDNSIDTIIINDVFEHLDQPEKSLQEAFRVLRKGGRIYLNFPPYHHPFGAHLSDAISIPWVHLFFSDATLIEVYKDAVAELPDGAERVTFRISEDGNGVAYFSYINKMTIARARRIFRTMGLKPIYYHEAPLRPIVALFAKLPLLKEVFVKMVVCVFEKE
jgi:ubiquinone/menaquinone biosynthesis C-methylase UbiE